MSVISHFLQHFKIHSAPLTSPRFLPEKTISLKCAILPFLLQLLFRNANFSKQNMNSYDTLGQCCHLTIGQLTMIQNWMDWVFWEWGRGDIDRCICVICATFYIPG
ncbi:hypothetical protein AX774_g933 [Zancudomyces culisetae]|uniref:Uncharacterized protein n=1 Tax=Zancudomyces culisetae TaxID=1213189 RepID=A0A1R1PX79_ZANCU|nr:hypothetical protein AX774_g933 [Zancudomyces culisetae]|eukprot:OMH85544.1 hypothetical protein AX774_g933 [Zancudomyces culisetae]